MQIIKDYLLWVVLMITLVLVYAVRQNDNSAEEFVVIQPRVSTQTYIPQTSQQPVIMTRNDGFELRKKAIETPINLFDMPVEEPAVVVYQSLTSTTQMVPTNPYRYVGKLLEDDDLHVFLTNGQNNFIVKTGDILNDEWKVTAMDSTEMVLLNIPTQTQITVQIGASL